MTDTRPAAEAAAGPLSQTLSRGLRILDLIAEAHHPLTIPELSTQLELHRSITYRLVRTLEDAAMIVRGPAGVLLLGPHIVTLARGVASDLQSRARPALQALADDLGMTAFLVVLDRADCVTLATVEPRGAVASIAQRPGTRHSVLVGAPGVAIQTLLGPDERRAHGLDAAEAPEVPAARVRGYASSHGEVIPGVTAVAAPIPGTVPGAIAVLFVAGDDVEAVGSRVQAAAASVAGSARQDVAIGRRQ